MYRLVAGVIPTGLSHPGGMRPVSGRLHSYGMQVLRGVRRFYRAMHPSGMRAQRIYPAAQRLYRAKRFIRRRSRFIARRASLRSGMGSVRFPVGKQYQ
jgi:hypothetical protein